jgi:hypothetical protein
MQQPPEDYKLVLLCTGRFVGLRCGLTYVNGLSFLVRDLRSFSFAELTELVAQKGGAWDMLRPWLFKNNLDSLLRGDSVSSDVLLALQDLSVKVEDLSVKVEDLSLMVRSIKAVQEPSISECGFETLGKFPPTDVSERPGAGDAFLSELEARHVLGFAKEHELVAWLTPKLAKLVPESSLQTLVNSEEYAWMETGSTARFFRKPDLFLVPSSFWRKKTVTGDNKGVLADWKLRDAVAVLVVAKMTALHEVIGQLVLGMRFLCKDAPLNLLRYGVALLQSDFYVLEFRDADVVAVEKCAWSAPGGLGLLKKAFCHFTGWSVALAKSCSLLDVQLTPNGFLGMGACGRVVSCTRNADGRPMALKIAMTDEWRVLALDREFVALKQARLMCAEHVIQVEAISPPGEAGRVYFAAYTMELGEPVADVSSWRVREACLMALLQLHLSGECHGDARVSNVVTVGGIYKWVDFMEARSFAGRDGSYFVGRDACMLVLSVYARVKNVLSALLPMPPVVADLISLYADCFVASIEQVAAVSLMQRLFQACESEFMK